MGILDSFQIKSRGWHAAAEHPWELDLDKPAVGGVALRDPATLLWKLGPTDDAAAAAQGRYFFLQKGVEAEVVHQRVNLWRVYWQDVTGRFSSFAGPCRFRSAPVELRVGMVEKDLENLFGPPVWRHEEKDVLRCFYGRHAAEWEWLLHPLEGLQQLTMRAMPLYAAASAEPQPSTRAT